MTTKCSCLDNGCAERGERAVLSVVLCQNAFLLDGMYYSEIS